MKKIETELTEENENYLFEMACKMCKHEELIQIGSRRFIMYFGPDHDSWEEVSNDGTY